MSETGLLKQKKRKRKMWRPVKHMDAGGCMNDEADGSEGDTL